MKLEKAYLILCLISIITLGSVDAAAQAPGRRVPPRKAAVAQKIVADKIHTRKAIRRTAVVIRNAQEKVKMNKNYTGDLSRAIAHQRFARKLYMKGMYVKAIRHTRVARMYAKKAIQANKGAGIAEANFTPEEEELMKDSPSDQELMEELTREEARPVINDEAFINEASDIDLRDNE
jgi:hypothetical protein